MYITYKNNVRVTPRVVVTDKFHFWTSLYNLYTILNSIVRKTRKKNYYSYYKEHRYVFYTALLYIYTRNIEIKVSKPKWKYIKKYVLHPRVADHPILLYNF